MTDTPEVPKGLRPANENPWYVLMTLHGEQEGEMVDWKLHEKNASLWNRLVSNSIGDAVREEARKRGLSVPSRDAHQQAGPEAWGLFQEVYSRRTKRYWHDRQLLQFRTELEMKELHFENTLVMQGMMIPRSLVLDGSSFDNALEAESAVFNGRVSFENVDVVAGVNLNKSYFSGYFSAKNSTFHEFLKIREAEFCIDVDFSKILVEGNLCAGDAIFGGVAELDEAKFQGAFFQGAKFQDEVSFANVNFVGEANFVTSEFAGTSDFQLCHFKSNACFQGAVFGSTAGFRSTAFDGGAWFTTGRFQKRVEFGEAKFNGETGGSGDNVQRAIRFDGCDFQAPVNFSHAAFSSSYPQLNGTSFPDEVSFSANKKYWPKEAPQDVAGSKEACATIRHVLTKQGLPEEAHFFFRREMHFAGLPSEGRSFAERLPYILFGWFSDYGYSIQRPLWWLAGVWFAGLLTFAYLFALPQDYPKLAKYDDWTAMGLSFSNLFPLFGFGRMFLSDVLKDLPRWAQFLSGAQTVLSLPLLFFLGLGLRQRFRLR